MPKVMTRCTCLVVKISKFHLIRSCTVLTGGQLKYWNSLYEVGFTPLAGFWAFLDQYLLNLKKPELKCFGRLLNFNVDVLNILGNVAWNVGVYVGLQ